MCFSIALECLPRMPNDCNNPTLKNEAEYATRNKVILHTPGTAWYLRSVLPEPQIEPPDEEEP